MEKPPLASAVTVAEGLYRTHRLSISDRLIPILCKAAASTGSLESESLFTYGDFCIGDVSIVGPIAKAIVDHVKSINKTKPIHIVFEDEPVYDFSRLLTKEQPSISSGFDDIFVSVIGRSYYKQCLPTESVNLSLSAFSLHRPDFETDAEFHVLARSVPPYMNPKWKTESKRRDDFERFLVHRARELKKDGHLVVVDYLFPSDFQTGTFTSDEAFKPIAETGSSFSEIYEELQKKGRLKPNENFFVAGRGRTEEEYKEPFVQDSSPVRKAGLRLCSLEKVVLPCPLTKKYLDGELSADEVGRGLISFMRSWSEFVVFQSLASERTEEEKQKIVEEVFARITERVTSKVPNVGFPYIVALLVAKKE